MRVHPAARVHAQLRPVNGGVRVTVRNTTPDPLAAQVIWDPPGGAGHRVELALGGYGVQDALLC